MFPVAGEWIMAKQVDEFLKYIRWASEVADQQAEWVRGKGRDGENKPSDEQIEAFREGMRQGYLKAIADVRLHGGKL